MRTVLKASMQTEAASAAIQDGSMTEILGKVLEELKPEAAYFYPENGKRTAFIVFDLTDSRRLPAISEPLFSKLEAEVSISPAMNVEDVRAGLAALKR
jgi:hypothetical protein